MNNKSNYNPQSLEFLLTKVCDDLESGRLSFEVPDYLIDFWNSKRKDYYESLEREKRFEQYVKLKEEFENG